jgi:hypothetical protein
MCSLTNLQHAQKSLFMHIMHTMLRRVLETTALKYVVILIRYGLFCSTALLTWEQEVVSSNLTAPTSNCIDILRGYRFSGSPFSLSKSRRGTKWGTNTSPLGKQKPVPEINPNWLGDFNFRTSIHHWWLHRFLQHIPHFLRVYLQYLLGNFSVICRAFPPNKFCPIPTSKVVLFKK